jgi:hypothetical protein
MDFDLPFVHSVRHAKCIISFLFGFFSRTGLKIKEKKMADVRDKKSFSRKKILSPQTKKRG